MKEIDIFTDGSDFNKNSDLKDKHCGFGIVIPINDNKLLSYSENINLEEWKSKYNIIISNPTLELLAIHKTIKLFCDNKSLNNSIINVYSDYEGCKKWIEGDWKAKKQYIKDILLSINICLEYASSILGLEFRFHWIKGHQKGDSYHARMNNAADLVAKDRKEYDTISSFDFGSLSDK